MFKITHHAINPEDMSHIGYRRIETLAGKNKISGFIYSILKSPELIKPLYDIYRTFSQKKLEQGTGVYKGSFRSKLGLQYKLIDALLTKDRKRIAKEKKIRGRYDRIKEKTPNEVEDLRKVLGLKPERDAIDILFYDFGTLRVNDIKRLSFNELQHVLSGGGEYGIKLTTKYLDDIIKHGNKFDDNPRAVNIREELTETLCKSISIEGKENYKQFYNILNSGEHEDKVGIKSSNHRGNLDSLFLAHICKELEKELGIEVSKDHFYKGLNLETRNFTRLFSPIIPYYGVFAIGNMNHIKGLGNSELLLKARQINNITKSHNSVLYPEGSRNDGELQIPEKIYSLLVKKENIYLPLYIDGMEESMIIIERLITFFGKEFKKYFTQFKPTDLYVYIGEPIIGGTMTAKEIEEEMKKLEKKAKEEKSKRINKSLA